MLVNHIKRAHFVQGSGRGLTRLTGLVVETLLTQAKRACETTIITGLYSTETLYLVPDNLRKLSYLASYKRLVVEPFLFGQTLQALGLKEEHANAIIG
ncbi:hypothetical protein LSAT2_016979 [Lamellibrachia satsuma]|nr:hypothetical protein LSAT2_016979 [Lamellibrachia satsuma]